MRLLLLLLLSLNTFGQSYKSYVDSLCSDRMYGRGYYKSGDSIAARYLEKEYRNIGLAPFHDSYLQKFYFSVNTFPGKADLKLDENILEAGKDFIPDPSSKIICGTYNTFLFDKNILHNKKKLKELDGRDFSKTVIILDKSGFDEKKNKSSKKPKEITEMILSGVFNNPATIVLEDKLTFGVSTFQKHPVIRLDRKKYLPSKTVTIDIESRLKEEHIAYNVAGMVRGTMYPDSFLVISAHYDHLGSIGGKAVFRGANDNASGVAMLLSLAEKIKKKPLPCSVAFLSFAGEEAGLLGSGYFTEQPLFPLSRCGFVMNFDITGTGNEGIMVVNATALPEYFTALKKANETSVKINPVKSRGQAAISDHYQFSSVGVPAFYIYTLGGSKAYHDINDVPGNLTFDVFEKLAELIYNYYSGPLK